VKKILFMLILIIFATLSANASPVASGNVKYQESEMDYFPKTRVLVLALDENFCNTYISSYSATVNNLAANIVNKINKTNSLRAIPIDDLYYKIKQNRLEPEIKKVIFAMHSKGIIDYRTLATICNILGTDEVVLLSGDFNTFKFLIQPHSPKALDFYPPEIIKPAYNIDITVSLIDPYKQAVLWDKHFAKKFSTISPQTDFEHNHVTVGELDRFSSMVSTKVVQSVNNILCPPQTITSVKSDIIKTNNHQTKEGVQTKDGHSISTFNRLVKPVKEKYYDWTLEHL